MSDESRLAVIENKMNYYETFLEKIDTAIVKMSEASSDISKMLAVHQEKIENNTKAAEIAFSLNESAKMEFNDKIEEIKNYAEQETNELKEEIQKIKSELIDFSKMRWMVNGIGIASGICITILVAVYQVHLTPQEKDAKVSTEQIQSK